MSLTKNNEEHTISDDDNDDDTFINNKETLDIFNLKLKENSEKYIISVNNVPQCYTDNIKDARNYMWSIARMQKMTTQSEYITFIRETEDLNKIQIVGYYKFYIVSFERTLSHFCVHKIKELYEDNNETYFEEINKPSMLSRWIR